MIKENCGCEVINCTVNNICDAGLQNIDIIFIFINTHILYIFIFLILVVFIGFYNFHKIHKKYQRRVKNE